ncbi:hypothetical protein LINGRAHAP2_LOCUS10409, partial [Linum grandiflorum]
TGGSIIQPSNRAVCGGVIRDSQGQVLHAFAANFGSVSITRAELPGAIHGFSLAWIWDFRRFKWIRQAFLLSSLEIQLMMPDMVPAFEWHISFWHEIGKSPVPTFIEKATMLQISLLITGIPLVSGFIFFSRFLVILQIVSRPIWLVFCFPG